MQLVAAPNGCGHLRHLLEHASCEDEVVGKTEWAFDRLGDVGDDAFATAALLVPEESEAAGGLRPDGPFRDDTALPLLAGPDGAISMT